LDINEGSFNIARLNMSKLKRDIITVMSPVRFQELHLGLPNDTWSSQDITICIKSNSVTK